MLWKYNFSCRYSCEIQLPRDINLLARVATAFQNNKLHFFIVSLSSNPPYCHQRGQTSMDLCWLLHSRRVTSLWTIFSNSFLHAATRRGAAKSINVLKRRGCPRRFSGVCTNNTHFINTLSAWCPFSLSCHFHSIVWASEISM